MHLLSTRQVRSALAAFAFALVAVSSHAAKDSISAPPAFTDTAHVMNGCFISSTAYLARFHAEFPGEKGTTLAVAPANYEMAHTVALISWKGSWFIRDEYFGVFPLNCAVKGDGLPNQIEKKASLAIEAYTTARINSGEVDADVVRRQLATSQQSGEVGTAASLLPLATEQFTITSKGKKMSFLFFRPADGVIAVYNPSLGTATAKCASHGKSSAIVASLVSHLGYKVDTVASETVIAASTITAGAVQVASMQ